MRELGRFIASRESINCAARFEEIRVVIKRPGRGGARDAVSFRSPSIVSDILYSR